MSASRVCINHALFYVIYSSNVGQIYILLRLCSIHLIFAYFRSNQIRSDHIRKNKFRSDQTRSVHIRLVQIMFMIEYRSIHGASTISLSFWLSWSFDMVSRASVTKRSRVRISSIPPFLVEYLAPGMRETCAASTVQAQRALAWGGVIEYRSIPGASTINLNSPPPYWVTQAHFHIKSKKLTWYQSPGCGSLLNSASNQATG